MDRDTNCKIWKRGEERERERENKVKQQKKQNVTNE